MRACSLGVFLCAAILGLGSFFAPVLVFGAAPLLVLAAILLRWRSRTAAVLLLLIAVSNIVVTVLSLLGVTSQAGTNLIFGIIVLAISVCAVEATFKLHGRLAVPPVGGA